MDTPQNLTTEKPKTDESAQTVSLSPYEIHGQTYIDFCAVQGMMTKEDGEIKQMSAGEFAGMIGVRRETLYDWQKRIPNFWDRVQERRKQIGGQNRIMKVYNGLYLRAAAGNPQAAAIWLANHDPDFRMPTQPVKHELGNSWAALLEQKRKAIDGEVADGSSPTN